MSTPNEKPPLLEVRGLTVRFSARGRVVTAVNDVSLRIEAGRTLGLVGESGCGKTTLARAILRLIPVEAGGVWLDGENVLAVGGRQLLSLRRRMQVIFQDPFTSLNPRHRIGRIVGEGLELHGIGRSGEWAGMVVSMLERVGLSADHAGRYPHELSGGQRQRVAIARALILRPGMVICDEPVSALDVSVQAQILGLLRELQAEFGLSYLFVGHNLGTVREVAHEIAVMQNGRIVERGEAESLLAAPGHSYTRQLLESVVEPPEPVEK